MKIENGKIVLEHAECIAAPNLMSGMSDYRDQSGNEISIPFETVLRICSILEHECKLIGIDFENWASNEVKGKHLKK